jgi:hypothetical protein
MGNIRYETHYASNAFIDEMRWSGRFGKMLHNGVDIVLFTLDTGERVSAHFIDSALPLYEIRHTLNDNASKGIATLFLLWTDMMLPAHGQRYRVDDWMEALYTLYGEAIYAYDARENNIYLYPVFFRGQGLVRQAEYGDRIPWERIAIRTRRTYLAGLQGDWLIADFGGERGTAHDPLLDAQISHELATFYALLGVAPEDSLEQVKQAYRKLARQLHPDLNSAPDAQQQMQQLNAAYARILVSRGE